MADVKDVLSAFSEEIRLRMAILLWDSTLCVNCLVQILNLPQSTVSRHLSLLRKSGILRATRDRSNCYYTVERKDPLGLLKQRLINAYYLTLKEIEPFMADSRRLEKIKKECNADCKVHIKKRGGRKNEKV